MKVTINYNDKTAVLTLKQRQGILNKVNALMSKESSPVSGTARVDYGKRMTNEFDFDGHHDLKKKLAPCLERELLEFLNGK